MGDAVKRALRIGVVLLAGAAVVRAQEPPAAYRLEPTPKNLQQVYSDAQIGLLEKLNRADRAHLTRLPQLVVPDRWTGDEVDHSPMPRSYEATATLRKALVVALDIQAFGAYEQGWLVRWGPVSTGARVSQTQPGRLSLNWKSPGRNSTVNPEWFMPWYFNFRSEDGVAFHAYALPGRPASHGCIRLLERDAIWLYNWGEEWTLDARGRLLEPGTPLLITGQYNYAGPPPWINPTTLGRARPLPEFPLAF